MTPNSAKHCDFCHSHIAAGQMWVRQKIHSPHAEGSSASYLYFHADPFPGDTESCWEKFEIQRDLLAFK
jgi:hypothetical protein